MLGKRGGQTHNDLDLVESLLRYPPVQVGNCCVVSHPRFGTSVYPATMFASAPRHRIDAALEAAERMEQQVGEPFEAEERTSIAAIFS